MCVYWVVEGVDDVVCCVWVIWVFVEDVECDCFGVYEELIGVVVYGIGCG